MAQPLLASWRIVTPYVASTLTHRQVVYCKADVAHPGPPQQLLYRDGSSVSWTVAALGLAKALAKFLASGIGTMQLQHLTGTVWNPIDTFLPGGLTYHGGAPVPCSQGTLFLRDSAFFKAKIVILESVLAPLYHDPGETTGDTGANAGTTAFADGLASADDPANWIVSRGNRYLHTFAAAGWTVTYNRKLRRRRGFV